MKLNLPPNMAYIVTTKNNEQYFSENKPTCGRYMVYRYLPKFINGQVDMLKIYTLLNEGEIKDVSKIDRNVLSDKN